MAATAANDFLGTGRRKSSVARVRLRPGSGNILVNKKPLDEYFVRQQDRSAVTAPLEQRIHLMYIHYQRKKVLHGLHVLSRPFRIRWIIIIFFKVKTSLFLLL